MFTGLIEEIGELKNINKTHEGCVLTISCDSITNDISLGDSICVNGVCQSVIEFKSDYIKTELSNETLSVTTFSNAKISEKVNLEKALKANSRLDGHIVNGHIEAVSNCTNIKDEGFSKVFTFLIPKNIEKYMVYKGSVAINGVSTTISDINNKTFSVTIIPITLKKTTFNTLKIGDVVNIETDITAKYIEKILLSFDNTNKIDKNLLEVNGFI